MSMKLFQLKKDREAALCRAEMLVGQAENGRRELTAAEHNAYDTAISTVNLLTPQIEALEKTSTIRKIVNGNGQLIPGNPGAARQAEENTPITLSQEYYDAFYKDFLPSKGMKISAALYEGANSAGGFSVPSMVDGQIVPLAPTETGVRKLARVIPTTMDIRIPRKSAHGTAASKAESGGSTNYFTETDPVLEQFTLTANMVGAVHTCSWELLQDVPLFSAFVVDDLLIAQATFEENWFVNGTGTGQAQGLLGNVGVGVTDEPDTNGNAVSIAATFDVLGTLNAIYHPRAAWLMSRATGVVIRRAQTQANLFSQVWTRVGQQDYLHGYPVEYSSAMPSATRGNTPVLFGAFADGYVIGDRGGSGINIKILDQPLATAGQVQILGYRRVDGRVRRSEAIQGITIASS